MGEMAVALASSIIHPIRTVKDLAQLPTTVARLLASSPEYFARYGSMSQEDQIREAARLSTHVLMMVGGAEASVGRMGGLGAELPMLSITARGEIVLQEVAAGSTSTAVSLGAFSTLHMVGGKSGMSGGPSGKRGQSARRAGAKGPGKWTYKKPTTGSEQALDYQEQITGRPAWYVYMVGKVEFDGFNGKALLEAKGASYKHFLKENGKAQPWFLTGDGFKGLMAQAEKQSELAMALKLPLVWHVAEVEFAKFLRQVFKDNRLDNIDVQWTPSTR